MLEAILVGRGVSTSNAGKLTLLTTTGIRAADWDPYPNAAVIDRTNDRIVVISNTSGNITNFDLLTNTWGSAINAGGYGCQYGTGGIEGYDGKAYIKWGQTGRTLATRSMMLQADRLSATGGWPNTMLYFSQVLVADTWYLFGGSPNNTVDGVSLMGVRTFNGVVSDHGTTNPEEFGVRYTGAVGTDGVDIYLFGGLAADSSGVGLAMSNDILKYTIATKTWSKLPTKTGFPIGGREMAPYYQGKFYFVGNSAAQGSEDNTWVWTYSPSTGVFEKWLQFPELQVYRQGLIFIYDDKLYYFCPYKNGASGSDIYTITLK